MGNDDFLLADIRYIGPSGRGKTHLASRLLENSHYGKAEVKTENKKASPTMIKQLQQCGVCGNASFEYGFFTYGANVRFNVSGETREICAECVNTLTARRGTYELRKEILNPVKEVK